MPKGRHFEQGVKLMLLRDYLCSHSGPTHKVSMEQIINHLAESAGKILLFVLADL